MSLDAAYQTTELSSGERCATCSRELPRKSLGSNGRRLVVAEIEMTAWVNEDIEGVFCGPCYRRWYSAEFAEIQEQVEQLPDNPFAQQVIRALVRRGGVISFTEQEKQAKVWADLDLTEYEQSFHWKTRRDVFIESLPKPLRCELCLRSQSWNGTRHVDLKWNVHHRSYERKGAELDSDLALLCSLCHLVVHKPYLEKAQLHFSRVFRDREDAVRVVYELLPHFGWG